MAHAPKPTPAEQLWQSLVSPNPPLVFDICTPEDHAAFPRLIPGSKPVQPAALDDLAGPCVFVCQKGKKLSQGAAALLTAKGHCATYLEGGIEGWHARGLATVDSKPAHTTRWIVADTPLAPVLVELIHWCYGRDKDVMIISPQACDAAAEKFGAMYVRSLDQFQNLADWTGPDFSALEQLLVPIRSMMAHATRPEAECISALALRSIMYKGLEL